jgi:NAD-dependent dihydropyrimidine dehydrogenase PreA subunit
MSEKLWYKTARVFIKAGRLPLPVTDTVIELLKTILTEEQAEFLLLFKKRSYNIDEIKPNTNLDDDSLNKMLNDLMYIGVISGIPSRTSGMMIYRVTPLLPGLLEFTLMRGGTSEKDKKIAKLHKKFFDDLVQGTQKNYDQMITQFKEAPPLDRVIPVEEEIETRQEVILPLEEISKILDNYDTIGVATCYCRHRKDLIGEPCKKTEDRRNCFSFGRTAEFLISQGFQTKISKQEALEILKKCEDDGLVHKAFHTNLDPMKEIDGICNCCKCCCGTFEMYYSGATPLMDLTSYLAKVNENDCVGCGTCVENCNAEAIELIDTIATVNENRCIGCGICAHLCPEKAIKMNKTEPRYVFLPPPKIKTV